MYYVELELPGIDGSGNVRIHWSDGNTLQIKATIHKTNLESVWSDNVHSDRSQKLAIHARIAGDKCDEQGFSGRSSPSGKGGGQEAGHDATTMTFWLNERKTGVFMRNISFAVAVDCDGVQARLREGLLMIMVPKKDAKPLKDKEIYIESD
jgi:HSP20 family protein